MARRAPRCLYRSCCTSCCASEARRQLPPRAVAPGAEEPQWSPPRDVGLLEAAASAAAALLAFLVKLLAFLVKLPLLLGRLLLRPAADWRRDLANLWQGTKKEAKRFGASGRLGCAR